MSHNVHVIPHTKITRTKQLHVQSRGKLHVQYGSNIIFLAHAPTQFTWKSCTYRVLFHVKVVRGMRKKPLGFQKHNPFTFPVHANMILPKSANQSNTSLGVRRSSRKKMSVERRAALIALREAGYAVTKSRNRLAQAGQVFSMSACIKISKKQQQKSWTAQKDNQRNGRFYCGQCGRKPEAFAKTSSKNGY